MYHLKVVLDMLPALNEADNVNWRVKQREKIKMRKIMDGQMWGRIPREPLERAMVSITRLSSSKPDYDNLVRSCKMVIDYFVRARVIIDDSMDHVSVAYHWKKTKRGDGRVIVLITEDGG